MSALAEALARAVPGLPTSDDPADRVAYARDLWPRHHLDVRAGRPAERRPALVAWPRTTDEVAKIVRVCHDTGTPLVPFGAGSGVCAGVLPSAEMLVLDLKRMAAVRSLDAGSRVVDVEAGAMGLTFEQWLDARGLTLGHFPSSILCSTVGGWVAARSAGQASGRYGKIEDMVLALECVTGTGEVVTLHRRDHGPDLVPLMVGSEGTLGVVTSATLRLFPKPEARAFGAFTFPTTKHGWEAMRAIFQAGLRPAVLRLYDPFDAMLARRGSVAKEKKGNLAPGLGGRALRLLLSKPGVLNGLVEGPLEPAFGGALVVAIFEGEGGEPARDLAEARRLAEAGGGRWDGEDQARNWLAHRYSVSYRQAPVFHAGLFSDTMEVAAPWSKLEALYEGVRRAVRKHAFVMAHLSHAYADGCCIYFSFAGSADRGLVRSLGWDAACQATYDRTWRAAMASTLEAGGTLAHHHGVGRSKAPRLREELGASGIATVKALMKAFDPKGILNPGNLIPGADDPYAPLAETAGRGARPAAPAAAAKEARS